MYRPIQLNDTKYDRYTLNNFKNFNFEKYDFCQ